MWKKIKDIKTKCNQYGKVTMESKPSVTNQRQRQQIKRANKTPREKKNPLFLCRMCVRVFIFKHSENEMNYEMNSKNVSFDWILD